MVNPAMFITAMTIKVPVVVKKPAMIIREDVLS
jgi:uncharacterized membrane protein